MIFHTLCLLALGVEAAIVTDVVHVTQYVYEDVHVFVDQDNNPVSTSTGFISTTGPAAESQSSTVQTTTVSTVAAASTTSTPSESSSESSATSTSATSTSATSTSVSADSSSATGHVHSSANIPNYILLSSASDEATSSEATSTAAASSSAAASTEAATTSVASTTSVAAVAAAASASVETSSEASSVAAVTVETSSSSTAETTTSPTSTYVASTSSSSASSSSSSSAAASSSTSSSSGEFSGQATYFDVGLGACGITNTDSDYIVALNAAQFGSQSNGNPICNKQILITRPSNGKTVTVTVTDKCPGCSYGDLDLSPAAFQDIADEAEGRVAITWDWA